MLLQVVQPWVIYGGMLLLLVGALYRWHWYKTPCYVMPYVVWMHEQVKQKTYSSLRSLLVCMRCCALIVLIVATSQLRYVDESSKIVVDGSDIMLVFDLSGSMQLFDDLKDRRSRFSVAQQELLTFIANRQQDQIGLIVFGATAVSRCPLTLDKLLLHDIVSQLALGDIAHNSTLLGVALSMAVNRLRHSQASSKIIIALTDGAPSDNDIPVDPVISLAQKYGIKIYTIGVGGAAGGYAEMPFHGIVRFETPLNEALLKKVAHETGGEFFLAEKPNDVQRVYAMIDQLEKTSYQAPLYSRHYDLFLWLLCGALVLLGLELIIRCWRTIV